MRLKKKTENSKKWILLVCLIGFTEDKGKKKKWNKNTQKGEWGIEMGKEEASGVVPTIIHLSQHGWP